jgi:hypothetical protein
MEQPTTRETMVLFLNDLIYCKADDDGTLVLDEDAEFYVDAYLESSEYEDIVKSFKKK